MSIGNLFNNNNYTIKCKELECTALTVEELINSSISTNELSANIIRSSNTNDVVINIEDGDALFTSDVNIEKTLSVEEELLVNGNCTCINLEATTLCKAQNLQATALCKAQNLEITDLCQIKELQFTTGLNQSILDVYRLERFSGSSALNVVGAIDPNSNITTNYSATRIGDFVCLTIESFPQQACSNTSLPIILETIDVKFRPGTSDPPSLNKQIACTLQVQINTGTITMGEVTIDHNGIIRIYSGFTNGSLFNDSANIRVGYSGSDYFTICYNV